MLAVLPVACLSLLSFVRSVSRSAAEGDISRELSAAAVGTALAGGLIALVFIVLRAGAQRVTRTLETQLPGAMTIGRLLYAEHTDTLIRAIGGKPATRPGFEYVAAAVAEHGLLLVDKRASHLVWVPSENILDVRLAEAAMLNGPARMCLEIIVSTESETVQIPFLAITEDSIIPRGMKEEALLELASSMTERLRRRRES
ncbi:hypothetical protein GCM10010471_09190 [Leucobacter komagatae]